jgi:6-phosphogluconolactonase
MFSGVQWPTFYLLPIHLPMSIRWHIAENEADWLARALAFVADAETRALAARGRFHIVLAGGGTPKRLYEALAGESHDWSRWHVWYGDERCLPPAHPERNSWMAGEVWLQQICLPEPNIHPIPAELGPVLAAEAYARQLKTVALFDLVLLGLGEDGHTASLFPGHDWGTGPDAPAVLPVFDAPKPPPERVSLSGRRLSETGQVLFLVTGAGKGDAVTNWRSEGTIPAAAIKAANGVDVLLDQSANGGWQ